MPPPKKKGKTEHHDDVGIMASPTNDTVLAILLEQMDLDTVDLFLQVSPVCRAWYRATSAYLLRVRAPEFVEEEEKGQEGGAEKVGKRKTDSDEEPKIVIETRDDFLQQWKREQSIFWKAHAAVYPRMPTDSETLEHIRRKTEAQRQLNRATGGGNTAMVEVGGIHYVDGRPSLVTPGLSSFLTGGERDTFNENGYCFFVRLMRFKMSGWFGPAPLKGVWRSSDSSEEFMLGEELGRKFPAGRALQLRLELSSLPWSSQDLQSMIEAPAPSLCWCPTQIIIVAVSKTTEEPMVLAIDHGHFKWNDTFTGNIPQLVHRPNKHTAYIDIKTDAAGYIEKADLLIAAVNGNFHDYMTLSDVQETEWRVEGAEEWSVEDEDEDRDDNNEDDD